MHRSLSGRLRGLNAGSAMARRGERGSTLIEVLVGVVLLGIVMVPLSMATVVAWRTVFGIQQKLSSSADAQLLAATFPADVQSAGATGVNPTDPVNADTCAVRAENGETSLIMFVWDEDLGVSNQSVVRYVADGSGSNSKIIRRFCKGNAAAEDTVVARNFGIPGIQEASLFTLGDDGRTSPQCSATTCFIKITGEYSFQLDVDRRTPGSAPGAYIPDAPTNVHALGGNNRATVYWTDPADNGGPITGYYLEQTPGGAVLGPFVTTGLAGAQVNALTNNQSYTFRVRAVNVLGPGPYSTPSSPVTPGPTTPDAPTIGTATPDSAANGKATVEWSLPSGYNDGGAALTGFTVSAQQGSGAPNVFDVTNPGATSLVVTGLADNSNYGFQVSARNAHGQGSPSATSTPAALTLPGAPGTPTATFMGVSGSVDVTFALPAGGDFTSFTNFRAHILSPDTYTTPVPAATACPGLNPTTCTLTVSGIGMSQSYSITVQAQNATGWGPESIAVANVDLTAPVVTIDTPSGGYVNSATPTIGGVAGVLAGDLPTITVEVYSGATVNGSPVQTVTATASGNTWSVPLSTLASGQYTVVATQMDSTGNTGTSDTRTFSIDTVAPTGLITAPSANAWVRGGAVTVSSNSADALSGVAGAEFQYSPEGADSWTEIDTDSSSPYSVSWDTTYLTDGEYDLRVLTTDNAGNTFTSPIRTVRSDNTDPTLGVALASGTLGTNGWYTGTVTVTWPTQPTDAYSGIATMTSCGTTTVSSDTAGQVVTCSATDNAGNTSSSSITIKKDATAPTSATLSGLGSFITNGKVLTGGGADATSGIDSITYLYCSGASCTPATTIGSSTAGSTYPVTWNGMPANGAYRVMARVFDEAGNFRNSSIAAVSIDTIAPTGSLTTPGNDSWARASITLAANSADTGGAGVQSATFQRSPSGQDDWTTIATDNSSPYSQSWNTTGVDDGPYDLRVVTQDNAGNTFTSPLVLVKVDNTAPTAGVASGAGTIGNNGWYTSNIVVTWPTQPTDAYSGLVSSPCGTTNIASDTSGQTVNCTGTDAAGNSTTTPAVFKRDATIPSSATLASLGATIADPKSMTGGGADATSGVNNLTYFFCAGTSCTPSIEIDSSSTASTYPVTWSGMPADGSYRVMSRVYDRAGNFRDSTQQQVTIDNTAPEMTSMVMQDSDNDGKVNRVLVTFDETLASYTAGTSPWDLDDVPSSGTISSVTVSGAVATINITEGSGAKDTAVGSFTVDLNSSATGIRDALGNRSSFGATAPTDGAKPVPVTMRLDNGGNNVGRIQEDDYITITYSEAMDVSSLCSTWSGNGSDQSRSVTVTLTDSGSSDYLTAGSPCSNIGNMDTNRSYTSNTRTFSGSTVHWDVSAKRLTVTLGTPSGSVSTSTQSPIAPTYTPTTGLEDPFSNSMNATAFTGTSSRF